MRLPISTVLGLFLVLATANGLADEKPWIGVFLDDAVDGGVRLIAVVPGGPADRAGLRPGDVVISVGGLRIDQVADLSALLSRVDSGAAIDLRLLRSGRPLERQVELGARPSSASIVGTVVPAPAPPMAPAPAELGIRGYRFANAGPELRLHLGAPPGEGVLVLGVESGESAMQVGDVLVRLGEEPVRRAEDVERLRRRYPGRSVPAKLVRDRRPVEVSWSFAISENQGESQAEAPGLDQQVQREIERLQLRVEELQRLLESMDAPSDDDR